MKGPALRRETERSERAVDLRGERDACGDVPLQCEPEDARSPRGTEGADRARRQAEGSRARDGGGKSFPQLGNPRPRHRPEELEGQMDAFGADPSRRRNAASQLLAKRRVGAMHRAGDLRRDEETGVLAHAPGSRSARRSSSSAALTERARMAA